MQTLETHLAKHPIFKGLDHRSIHALTIGASPVLFSQGTYLFHEGEAANHFYILCKGKVGLETFEAKLGPITLETIEEGEVLGWSWLFAPYRWHFSARALEPLEAIALDGATLRDLADRDHDFGYELVRRVAYLIMQRLYATRLQLLDMYAI